MKPSAGDIANAASDAETQKSPAPAERLSKTQQQIATDDSRHPQINCSNWSTEDLYKLNLEWKASLGPSHTKLWRCDHGFGQARIVEDSSDGTVMLFPLSGERGILVPSVEVAKKKLGEICTLCMTKVKPSAAPISETATSHATMQFMAGQLNQEGGKMKPGPCIAPFNGEGQAATSSIQITTLDDLVPLRDKDRRRLVHVTTHDNEPVWYQIKLNGVTYVRDLVIPMPFNWWVTRYRELSPEEESHLEHNRVDTSHDGILA